MNAGSIFERVYSAIKEDLLRGAYRPGDTLEPRQIGAQLFASVTPVRDALHRLAGERLIEATPHDGFRRPLLTENGLRDLYRWQEVLALAALRMKKGFDCSDAGSACNPSTADAVERTRRIFAGVAALSSSAELQIAMLQTTDRLEPVRHLEPRFLPDLDQELRAIEEGLIDRDLTGVRHHLQRYRARRYRLAPHLVTALLSPAP
ncbi:GntR family transcriptional regulator [Sphingomonas sp. ID1715]|uniref:GntR family transcriptional regulator n=1 Tax=Sphingomonas sp. ID1715 TaxID=1656898 RepID=UPI001488E0A0|nr:GntR family transcriptional regulator [Sphingomonas sp. ID1715]